MDKQFEDIVREMVTAEREASIDLASVPVAFKGSQSIAKANAQSALVTLREEYRKHLAERVATIWLSGSKDAQEKFAKLAETEGDTLTVSALEAYNRMAQDIEPTIGGERQFGGTQLGHLLRSLETVAREAGASFLPVPRLYDVLTVSDFDSLVFAIRDIIITQVGEKMNSLFIEEQILRRALDTHYEVQKIVPVVIMGFPEGESDKLRENVFNGRGIVVKIDKEDPDKSFVLRTFDELRYLIKKLTQPTANQDD